MIEEKELLATLRNKDKKEEGFRILIEQYKERLYWQIRNMVINHDDADDILQNTFIKIFKNIEFFKEESKLHTWMYRIAANESITFLNKKAKQKNVSFEKIKSEVVKKLETDIYFEGDAFQRHFQKAIATLPERQQLIFTMKYFSDHTFEELSKILETSVGGLKSSYHIAVKKITAFIQNNEIE